MPRGRVLHLGPHVAGLVVDPEMCVHVDETRQNRGLTEVNDIGWFPRSGLRSRLDQADSVALHPDGHPTGPARIPVP
jgi:hypothetical protein